MYAVANSTAETRDKEKEEPFRVWDKQTNITFRSTIFRVLLVLVHNFSVFSRFSLRPLRVQVDTQVVFITPAKRAIWQCKTFDKREADIEFWKLDLSLECMNVRRGYPKGGPPLVFGVAPESKPHSKFRVEVGARRDGFFLGVLRQETKWNSLASWLRTKELFRVPRAIEESLTLRFF